MKVPKESVLVCKQLTIQGLFLQIITSITEETPKLSCVRDQKHFFTKLFTIQKTPLSLIVSLEDKKITFAQVRTP